MEIDVAIKKVNDPLLKSVLSSCAKQECLSSQGDLGLFTGYTGMVIVYLLLAKAYSISEFERKAHQLLDKISDEANQVEEADFSSGFSGIGWAVEWIVQNDLLKGTDTDDVLADVDEIVYRSIILSSGNRSSLQFGALGKAYYFLKRGFHYRLGSGRYTPVTHQESLLILSEEIEKDLRGTGGIFESATNIGIWSASASFNQDIIDIAYYTMIFGDYGNRDLMFEQLFADSLNIIERVLHFIIEENPGIVCDHEIFYNLFFVSIYYLITARKKSQPCWEDAALFYIERLQMSDMQTSQMEPNTLLFKRLTIYSLLNIYDPKENYRNMITMTIRSLMIRNLRFSIVGGWGSLILAILSADNRELGEKWHEIMFWQ